MRFYHIVNRDLVNLSQEELSEHYWDGDNVYMTEAGSSLLHHLDFSIVETLIKDYEEE